MPSSVSNGKNMIGKFINNLITNDDFRVLDLGCGKGTYGSLITKPCKKIAVDVVDYESKFGLKKIYDKFVVANILDKQTVESLGCFDLIILGDVLEHLTKEEARFALDYLEKMTKIIIVAVPYLYPQNGGKNHWETHKQPELTRNLFLERYSEFKLLKEYSKKQEPFYGYFVWRIDKNGEKT